MFESLNILQKSLSGSTIQGMDVKDNIIHTNYLDIWNNESNEGTGVDFHSHIPEEYEIPRTSAVIVTGSPSSPRFFLLWFSVVHLYHTLSNRRSDRAL